MERRPPTVKENKSMPHFVRFLPAPEHFDKRARNLWRRQGYGMWIGINGDGLKDPDDAMQISEQEVAKSIIANTIIGLDAPIYSKLKLTDRKRQTYDWIVEDNNKRLKERTTKLGRLIEGHLGADHSLSRELVFALEQMARDFVEDSLSTLPDKHETARTTLRDNLEKIGKINSQIKVLGAYGPFDVRERVSAQA